LQVGIGTKPSNLSEFSFLGARHGGQPADLTGWPCANDENSNPFSPHPMAPHSPLFRCWPHWIKATAAAAISLRVICPPKVAISSSGPPRLVSQKDKCAGRDCAMGPSPLQCACFDPSHTLFHGAQRGPKARHFAAVTGDLLQHGRAAHVRCHAARSVPGF
jgi:hypothetical protein